MRTSWPDIYIMYDLECSLLETRSSNVYDVYVARDFTNWGCFRGAGEGGEHWEPSRAS